MSGLTWKMWFIGCYGIFCCALLLQTWPVTGFETSIPDKMQPRRRDLKQVLRPTPSPSTLPSPALSTAPPLSASPPPPPQPPSIPPSPLLAPPPSQPPPNPPPSNPPSQPPSNAPPSTPPSQPPSNAPPSTPPSQTPSNTPPSTPPSQPPSNAPPSTPPSQPPSNPPPTSQPPPTHPLPPLPPPSSPIPTPSMLPPSVSPPASPPPPPAPFVAPSPSKNSPPPFPPPFVPPSAPAPSPPPFAPPPDPPAPPVKISSPPATPPQAPSPLPASSPPSAPPVASPATSPGTPPVTSPSSSTPSPPTTPPTPPPASPPLAVTPASPPLVSPPSVPPSLPPAPPPTSLPPTIPPSPMLPPPSTPPVSTPVPPAISPSQLVTASPPLPSPMLSPITSPPLSPAISPPSSPSAPTAAPSSSPPTTTPPPTSPSPNPSTPPPSNSSPPPATSPASVPPSPSSPPPVPAGSPPSPSPILSPTPTPSPSPSTSPVSPIGSFAPPPKESPPPASPPSVSPPTSPPVPPPTSPPNSSPSPSSPPPSASPILPPGPGPVTPPVSPPLNPPLAQPPPSGPASSPAPESSNSVLPPLSPPVTPPTSTPPATAPSPVAPPPFVNVAAPSPYALAPGPAVQGCCPSNMMLLPGSLGAVTCKCVYPLTVKLRFDNASTTFPSLSAEFQHELASQLNLSDVQVLVSYFKFGVNTSFAVLAATKNNPLNTEADIGPISGKSFPASTIAVINSTLWSHTAQFNKTYFGNYTVLSVTTPYLPPPAPPPPNPPPPPPPPPAIASSPVTAPKQLPIPVNTSSKSSSKVGLIAGIAAGVVALAALLLVGCFVWRLGLRNKHNRNSEGAGTSRVSAVSSPQGGMPISKWTPADSKSFPRPKQTREFTYEELSEATNGFAPSAFIGEGGFGKVYGGKLEDGTAVAIKKLTTGGNQGDREFLVEVEMLSRLHHRHLVKLLGYFCCREPLQQLLCYELIPNGSLESWLHGSLGTTIGPLDWPTRMKIAIGAARGLAYLHEDSQPCVIHRDFKASNILLQNNFHAKVADFGLARLAPESQGHYVSTRVMGTFGYVAPEYAMTGHLLVKSDVYSYGVVLLELLSGRKPVDYTRAEGENITSWARPLLTDRSGLAELADPRLGGKFSIEDFEQVSHLAARCIDPEWRERPSMGEVVQNLKSICKSHEYNLSSEGERLTSSEHERGTFGSPAGSSTASSHMSFALDWPPYRPTTGPLHSDSSSPMYSTSGPFGIGGIDNDPLSRTTILSEDLHEGR